MSAGWTVRLGWGARMPWRLSGRLAVPWLALGLASLSCGSADSGQGEQDEADESAAESPPRQEQVDAPVRRRFKGEPSHGLSRRELEGIYRQYVDFSYFLWGYACSCDFESLGFASELACDATLVPPFDLEGCGLPTFFALGEAAAVRAICLNLATTEAISCLGLDCAPGSIVPDCIDEWSLAAAECPNPGVLEPVNDRLGTCF